MTEQTEEEFRPVDIEFLAQGGGEPFDIYIKSDSLGSVSFVKFASTRPKHQEKVLRLLEEGDADLELFIQEEDLFKYYQCATKSLLALVNNPKIPHKEKTQKIYDVSKGVMKEFFDFHASGKILESSEEVMGMMEECMSSAEGGFGSIAQIANKDYYTHTHSVNVGLYCMTYGIKSGMNKDEARQLGLGGMLHDVGKSKVPESIINKSGKLTDEEFTTMKAHSPDGAELLSGMKCYTNNVVRMAREHHENFGGGG
ncbi:MAG: HD domain-containing phosphohydrolase, partial [Nitrospinaceae bacterium]